MHLLAVSLFIFCLSFSSACQTSMIYNGARQAGDIMILVIMPAHQVMRSSETDEPGSVWCERFDVRAFIWIQSVIHAINRINSFSTLLPGVKLGYEIHDSCSDVSMALRNVMKFVLKSNSSDYCSSMQCDYVDNNSYVKIVLGDVYSEISMAIARLLKVFLFPQISPGSTNGDLSDKTRYSTFIRVVPSDEYQANALIKMVKAFHFVSVGVISSNSDYGKYGSSKFISLATENNICIPFTESVSDSENEQTESEIHNIVDTIKNSHVEAILIFAMESTVKNIFAEVMKQNLTNNTWIASEAWSTSSLISRMDNITTVGQIFGLSLKKGIIPGFQEYLGNILENPDPDNCFLEEYIAVQHSCFGKGSPDFLSNAKKCQFQNYTMDCSKIQLLKDFQEPLASQIDFEITYSVYLAVTAIAQAIHELLNCDTEACDQNFNFAPWQLLKVLKKVNFTVDGKIYSFNDEGDINSAYDIKWWKANEKEIKIIDIGEYSTSDNKISQHQPFVSIYNKSSYVNCIKECPPGYFKNVTGIKCCYKCDKCGAGTYSKGGDATECSFCESYQNSESGSSSCYNKTIEFFAWNDGLSITLLVFCTFGIIIILVLFVIFTMFLSTPAVKCAGGKHCYLMLFSLLISNVDAVLFIGEPQDILCKIRQPLFGLSFVLCLCCILINLLQISVAFQNTLIKSTFKSYLVFPVFLLPQIIVCTLWLVLAPPQKQKTDNGNQIILGCSEGSPVAFWFMLAYVALLALVCFVITYKGRHLPDAYKNCKFITIAMVIYIVVWISFIPAHVNTVNKFLPAVEMIAILASNYAILCCHFFPKCYIIFFQADLNTEDAYKKIIREYIERTQKKKSTPETGS
ncbi:G-protein coupled receptor family C group 6 member A-like [Polypterus senegalus]|uniref:G-protein coupled receptor family C group 6 member A-like n=1 Tax=Polypterus senegalus TaxID=55291 RepID=UPI001963808A|nr:G-protein coupled receptor family C group 6 member A-like [Polypterus senegalus]